MDLKPISHCFSINYNIIVITYKQKKSFSINFSLLFYALTCVKTALAFLSRIVRARAAVGCGLHGEKMLSVHVVYRFHFV